MRIYFQCSGAVDMRNWNAARIFSYKEIKAATNNFKEVIGRGSFGSVYLGKLSDGKLVAVKVRFDKSQLGADSFINEVYCLNFSALASYCVPEHLYVFYGNYLILIDELFWSKEMKYTAVVLCLSVIDIKSYQTWEGVPRVS